MTEEEEMRMISEQTRKLAGGEGGTSKQKYDAAYQPVNEELPSASDLAIDRSLASYMTRHVILDTKESMAHRNEVLSEIRRIFLNWIKQMARENANIRDEEEIERVGGFMLVSGSHRLGVQEPGADIDTVCVAPSFCKKEDFFGSLKKILMAHRDVKELNAAEGAKVPIIELEFRGINIDLLFARMAEKTVPVSLETNIDDDNILRGLDDATVTTLNGPRVTDMIGKLANPFYPNFLIVLRIVRKWAKARGLYGNKFGFLGGVNFNILVTFIGQLYPKASPSALLDRFFRVYRQWRWGENPILLTKIRQPDKDEFLTVWKNNGYELMPILTPAYPAANSSFTVNIHSLGVMRAEFERGHTILQDILKEIEAKGSAALPDETDGIWSKLFEPSDFFVKYSHYLRCNILGGSDPIAANAWTGFVESRIRKLVTYLEPLPIMKPIHFYPVKNPTKDSEHSLCYFIGFNADKARLKTETDIYLDKALSNFKRELQNYSGPRPTDSTELSFFYEHYKWSKLPKEVFEKLGGKDEAKKKRKALFAPAAEAKAAAEAAAAEGGVVKTEDGIGEDEEEGSRKRKLDDIDGEEGVEVEAEAALASFPPDYEGLKEPNLPKLFTKRERVVLTERPVRAVQWKLLDAK